MYYSNVYLRRLRLALAGRPAIARAPPPTSAAARAEFETGAKIVFLVV
jgi:hypothetical protein